MRRRFRADAAPIPRRCGANSSRFRERSSHAQSGWNRLADGNRGGDRAGDAFDSPFGLAQGRLAAQARQAGTSRAAAKPYTTWQSYAGGAHSSQYSALDQINKKNVAKLQVAWSFPITGNSIFNPVVVDGVMYAPVGGGALAAIDAATGKEIWRKEGAAPSGARGMNYWESPDRSDRRFIYLQRGDVIAVNAQDGELDHLLRQQRSCRSTRGDGAEAGRSCRDQQPRPDLREPLHHSAARWTRATAARPPTSTPTTCGPESSPGSSMSFRTKGSSATTRGRKATRRSRRWRAQLERVHRRRGERHRVRRVRQPALRLLRRRSQGQQPVRQLARRDRRPHRQADLASAAHSPRPLGLGHSAVGQAADDPPERQAAPGRRAGDEAGVPLRLRSEDRPADLADRGAAGSADRRARRVDVPDAAVPDEAGAVCQAVVHREGHQPVPAEGGAGRAAGAAAVVSQRGHVHSARASKARCDAGAQRRRELRDQRGRSRPRRVLRRPQVAADDDPASRCRHRPAAPDLDRAVPAAAAVVAVAAAAATRSSRPSRRRS